MTIRFAISLYLLFRRDMDGELSPVKSELGVELNRRGIPARKRKKNSLIFGDDDLVSLPVRSPRKKGTPAAAAKQSSSQEQPARNSSNSKGDRQQLQQQLKSADKLNKEVR